MAKYNFAKTAGVFLSIENHRTAGVPSAGHIYYCLHQMQNCKTKIVMYNNSLVMLRVSWQHKPIGITNYL